MTKGNANEPRRNGILGSARVSRAGNRVLAVADFLLPRRTSLVSGASEVRFGEDAEPDTRDACATQNAVPVP
jgi:hypothetical protein